jgi:hypothetical protein
MYRIMIVILLIYRRHKPMVIKRDAENLLNFELY